MPKSNDRREEALDRMADFVLANGIGASTLRPLAAAAGTSDRMLLYYFKDKDELLTATLSRLAERMTARLDTAMPGTNRMPFDRLLAKVWGVLSSESLLSYMPLWLELAAGASRKLEPQLRISGQIADSYLGWISNHLASSPGRDTATEAARFMVMIEGMYLVHAVGRPHLATAVMRPLKV